MKMICNVKLTHLQISPSPYTVLYLYNVKEKKVDPKMMYPHLWHVITITFTVICTQKKMSI